jgi:hypothetical protein
MPGTMPVTRPERSRSACGGRLREGVGRVGREDPPRFRVPFVPFVPFVRLLRARASSVPPPRPRASLSYGS